MTKRLSSETACGPSAPLRRVTYPQPMSAKTGAMIERMDSMLSAREVADAPP
jgi:hypothetical protein